MGTLHTTDLADDVFDQLRRADIDEVHSAIYKLGVSTAYISLSWDEVKVSPGVEMVLLAHGWTYAEYVAEYVAECKKQIRIGRRTGEVIRGVVWLFGK